MCRTRSVIRLLVVHVADKNIRKCKRIWPTRQRITNLTFKPVNFILTQKFTYVTKKLRIQRKWELY